VEKAEMSLFGKLGTNKFIAGQVAKRIPKEEFLSELKSAWAQVISKNSDIDLEVGKAQERIRKSGFESVFKSAGITTDDLRNVIKEIQAEKSTPEVRTEPKIGRNEPCPCGSGKKYKKCCGAGK
jgi:preprotein translocase subunit SecA